MASTLNDSRTEERIKKNIPQKKSYFNPLSTKLVLTSESSDDYDQEEFLVLSSLSLTEVLNITRKKNVIGDGNCFYRALSLFLYNSEDYYQQIRKDISDWALKNLELLISDGLSESDLRKYFLKQKNSSAYAEKETIMAAAYFYGIVILLWSQIKGAEDDTFSHFIPQSFEEPYEKSKVMLLFLKDSHFQLLEIKYPSIILDEEPSSNGIIVPINSSDSLFPDRPYELTFDDVYQYLVCKKENKQYYSEKFKKLASRRGKKSNNEIKKLAIAYSQWKRNIMINYELSVPPKDSLSKSTLFYKGRRGNKPKQVPFATEIDEIIQKLHVFNSRHLPLREHIAKVSSLFFWDSVVVRVGDFHKSCLICKLKSLTLNTKPLKPRVNTILSTRPLERVQIDLVQIPKNFSSDFKYIMTVKDHFSRMAWAYLLLNKTCGETSKYLGVFLDEWTPQIIQTDNGTEFKGSFHSLLEQKNIKHIKGRPYHPESQGSVEAFNKYLKQEIPSYLFQLGKKKKVKLPEALENF